MESKLFISGPALFVLFGSTQVFSSNLASYLQYNAWTCPLNLRYWYSCAQVPVESCPNKMSVRIYHVFRTRWMSSYVLLPGCGVLGQGYYYYCSGLLPFTYYLLPSITTYRFLPSTYYLLPTIYATTTAWTPHMHGQPPGSIGAYPSVLSFLPVNSIVCVNPPFTEALGRRNLKRIARGF